jgi:trk system potassium uptake protein TrkH
LPAIDIQPAGILYWRSLLHWLGGAQLYHAEVPGPQVQRWRPKMRDTAKVLLWIYLALSIAQMAALVLAGMSPFEA